MDPILAEFLSEVPDVPPEWNFWIGVHDDIALRQWYGDDGNGYLKANDWLRAAKKFDSTYFHDVQFDAIFADWKRAYWTVEQATAFRMLAADHTEHGINLATQEGQEGIDRVLDGTDLIVLDNLSTLFPNGSESASDAWGPMQNWLLKLRRRGVSVLFVHHAGTNGRQRGTSRREDVLDTVIALRRPANYSPDQGARFEVHFEKLRHRVGEFAQPFEASAEAVSVVALELHGPAVN